MLHTEDFIKRLEFILEHFGLSASAFADKINVQRSSISHLLSGRNKPSLEFVMKVIDIFPELNLYWLLDGKGSFLKKSDEVFTAISAPPASPLTKEIIAEGTGKPFPEETNNEIDFSKPANIFSQKSIGKSIDKIVLLYTDGTFDEYKSSNLK